MDKHSFPNGKRLVRDTLKPVDNLHYEKFSDGTVNCIEDEIPFELPDGWSWSRLEPIASLITDYVANGSFASLKANVRTYKEKNYALFVRTVDFANNFKGDLSYIDKESYDFLEKSKLYGGELMLSNIGASIGKVFKVPHLDTPMSLAPNAIILRFFYDITCDYFEYVFKSFVGQDYLQFLSGGAAMPKFNKTDLRAMIVPVPPIKEQERIVESVKNIFIGIDDLDISYSGLANTIQSVKSKILDLAIRGKLVPQDPNDEPASVLLERIRAEKEELIKQGKIKRDKKESVIFKGDDNSYYQDLPKMWELVNFKDCATLISGRDLNKNEYNAESIGIPYITGASNFINGNILINRWTTVPKTISEVNDILITCKGTVGELAINKYGNIHIARQIMAIRIYKNINLEYIKFFLESIVMEIKKTANGLIPGISRDDILSLNIPLPSLTEQKRIVDEIEKIFATLDDIANQVA